MNCGAPSFHHPHPTLPLVGLPSPLVRPLPGDLRFFPRGQPLQSIRSLVCFSAPPARLLVVVASRRPHEPTVEPGSVCTTPPGLSWSAMSCRQRMLELASILWPRRFCLSCDLVHADLYMAFLAMVRRRNGPFWPLPALGIGVASHVPSLAISWLPVDQTPAGTTSRLLASRRRISSPTHESMATASVVGSTAATRGCYPPTPSSNIRQPTTPRHCLGVPAWWMGAVRDRVLP